MPQSRQFTSDLSIFPRGYPLLRVDMTEFSSRVGFVIQLEAISLFRHLNAAELKALRSVTQERKVGAGGVIFREGDPGDGVYFVKSGLVEISGGKTERRVFSRLGPGEI